MGIKDIKISGAREHNLKNINITIPRDKFVIITGLSGSGKSSLAFDTIYAEGQRRYVESLSAYARQFLELMQKPDVENIEGLSPAISIEQKTTSKNPRSTVGTVTEIFDYMRLLWARVGVPYSPTTGKPIKSQSVSQMVDILLSHEPGTKFLIISPVIRSRKGSFKKDLLEFKKQGFLRAIIDGNEHILGDEIELNKNQKHDIDIVVDRIILKKEDISRYDESIETALRLSEGLCVLEKVKDNTKDQKKNNDVNNSDRILLSSKFSCPVSGFTIEEIEPRIFSFNNPKGACSVCDGIGVEMSFDENLIVPDDKLSIKKGAIKPWFRNGQIANYYKALLKSVADHYKISLDTPFGKIPKKIRDKILYGTGDENISISFFAEKTTYKTSKPFEGVISSLQRRYLESDSNYIREELEKYQSSKICSNCHGQRLNDKSLCVKIAGFDIMQISAYSIEKALDFFANLHKLLDEKDKKISERILKEICDRLHFLCSVGLAYLSLARSSGTLSGGESQRIRLASQIGSGLTGVLYVLDEPSIGLHQCDNERLLHSLRNLVNLGNSVIVVEHDEEAITSADHIIDMGPKAGINGGEVVFSGTYKSLLRCRKSLTADYLSGRRSISFPKNNRKVDLKNAIEISSASGNNLKNINVKIPLKNLVIVTGVSGSGKSTLINETLYPALAQKVYSSQKKPAPFKKISGYENIDKIIEIDQSPIGRTPRSNPATYTGVFTPIREWYAALPEAKERGYTASRFSFNVKGGRCEECKGDGVIKIEMHFLPDVYVVCDLCKGKRYNRETLQVKFRSKTISDILEMSIEEGVEFFKAIPNIRDKLNTLLDVGLGYIKIGQQATTLSGGEAQRVKLAKELSKRSTGKTFYILDEPTTGLHFEDINNLMKIIHKLVDSGNSVVIIEHNLDVINQADYIIDLGPNGGENGGEIVFTGTREKMLNDKKSITAKFLRKHIERVKEREDSKK